MQHFWLLPQEAADNSNSLSVQLSLHSPPATLHPVLLLASSSPLTFSLNPPIYPEKINARISNTKSAITAITITLIGMPWAFFILRSFAAVFACCSTSSCRVQFSYWIAGRCTLIPYDFVGITRLRYFSSPLP